MDGLDNKERIIRKFEALSDRYHKLSLLLYELSNSLRIESSRHNYKEFKNYIKSLNLDIDLLIKLSSGLTDIKLLKKEVLK